MPDLRSSLYDLGALDQAARQDTPVHRLDPRAKILATLALIAVTVSFGRHEISALLPLAFYPVVILSLGRVSLRPVLRKLLLALPFVLLVGLFNPLLDREVVVRLGPLGVSGGWMSFLSVLLRSALALGSALALVAVTGMPAVGAGLERLGVPRPFVVQLLLLHRYLFLLGEEALRMVRARSLRAFNGRGAGWRVTASLLGHLLLRTLDRAERIHTAMNARGFRGEVRIRRPLRFSGADLAFAVGWSAFFVVARSWNLPRLVGALAAGALR